MHPLRTTTYLLLPLLALACSPRNADEPADRAVQTDGAVQNGSSQRDGATMLDSLPASATTAQARLAASPRHGEWQVIRTGANDSIRVWVVYPERSTPAPVVLVVHEIFGLSHWVRAVADQLAADGFIAIAPDLLTMSNVPVTASGEPDPEQARARIGSLEPDTYHAQLAAIAGWGMALPAATDRYGIVGFCWGGAASFQHAISAPDVSASVVYYGPSPDAAALQRVNAPVLGLYAGDDERVNATIARADSVLRGRGLPWEYHVFEGAGHGFLRQQDGRDGANLRASREAWPRTVAFFREHLDAR